MVSITATNSTTPSMQAVLGRAKLQQARRDADQAESKAQQLREQADAAENDVRKTQNKVSSIAAQLRKDSTLTYAPSGSSGTRVEVPRITTDPVARPAGQDGQKPGHSAGGLVPNTNTQGVVNSQGHATGRIVNVIA